jgi:hypothetical protein
MGEALIGDISIYQKYQIFKGGAIVLADPLTVHIAQNLDLVKKSRPFKITFPDSLIRKINDPDSFNPDEPVDGFNFQSDIPHVQIEEPTSCNVHLLEEIKHPHLVHQEILA